MIHGHAGTQLKRSESDSHKDGFTQATDMDPNKDFSRGHNLFPVQNVVSSLNSWL